ncbi:hypothetical protein FGB62_73g027 [Gracilaria domingensis]|nr:hypothetical protein FGB62_73g027 [Gracilaria domingensis]
MAPRGVLPRGRLSRMISDVFFVSVLRSARHAAVSRARRQPSSAGCVLPRSRHLRNRHAVRLALRGVAPVRGRAARARGGDVADKPPRFVAGDSARKHTDQAAEQPLPRAWRRRRSWKNAGAGGDSARVVIH